MKRNKNSSKWHYKSTLASLLNSSGFIAGRTVMTLLQSTQVFQRAPDPIFLGLNTSKNVFNGYIFSPTTGKILRKKKPLLHFLFSRVFKVSLPRSVAGR